MATMTIRVCVRDYEHCRYGNPSSTLRVMPEVDQIELDLSDLIGFAAQEFWSSIRSWMNFLHTRVPTRVLCYHLGLALQKNKCPTERDLDCYRNRTACQWS